MRKIENNKFKDYIKVRRTWTINPRTRLHDEDKRMKTKKSRQNKRQIIREAMKEYNSSLPNYLPF